MGKLSAFYRYHHLPNKKKVFDDEYKIPEIKAKTKPEIISNIIESSKMSVEELMVKLESTLSGIDLKTAKKRIFVHGLNVIAQEKRNPWLLRFFKLFINPLNILFCILIAVSLLTKDMRTAVAISFLVLVSVIIRFIQEEESYASAKKLKSLVKTTCAVLRNDKVVGISLSKVVPGDVVVLSAGDIIPADLRLIESKDLFINQSVLTGEALPIEKHAQLTKSLSDNPLEMENICYMGTNVESGHAKGIVFQTGVNSYFGSLAKSLVGERSHTNFDKGIDRFTWLMVGYMAVMVPAVFLINGLSKGNWVEAFLFGISIAVGLTPEMLPAIVTINLSQGSRNMAKKKVIVKRMNSIQNLGAMNILCTDKTGTLTQNRVVLIDNINIKGKTDPKVLEYAFVNSYHQTGFKNLLDSAVIRHGKKNIVNSIVEGYAKIDELPFDFKRRRLSIITQKEGKRMLICKGALEEVVGICTHYEFNGKINELGKKEINQIIALNNKYSQEGFRIIAIAYCPAENNKDRYSYSDEKELVFLGMMTFLDPPKESASQAIAEIKRLGVDVKVLTGDNEMVTKKIAQEVGLEVTGVVKGSEIEKMSDNELKAAVEANTIFAKLSPEDKRRIVVALQKSNHVVGFLGDGINDAPALRTADVGVSVDKAVDVAKESADMILLEMDLCVMTDGIIEGRKVFGNIMKYVKMGASSNFGNMFSLLGASLFLPFLPMKPSQLLTAVLLYDLSQTAIPTDTVDEEYIKVPRKWRIGDIGRFMLFIGPVSSIFDYITFFIMLYVFSAGTNASLFQTGWFIESLVTQTMIVHVIRSRKMPFFQTWASKPLIITTISIISVGIALTISPFSSFFDFVKLPGFYWPLLFVILISYIFLMQVAKTFYIKKFGYS